MICSVASLMMGTSTTLLMSVAHSTRVLASMMCESVGTCSLSSSFLPNSSMDASPPPLDACSSALLPRSDAANSSIAFSSLLLPKPRNARTGTTASFETRRVLRAIIDLEEATWIGRRRGWTRAASGARRTPVTSASRRGWTMRTCRSRGRCGGFSTARNDRRDADASPVVVLKYPI